MSKLPSKAKNHKLKESLQQSSKTKSKERLVRQFKHKEYPRSYRLDSEIMNSLSYFSSFFDSIISEELTNPITRSNNIIRIIFFIYTPHIFPPVANIMQSTCSTSLRDTFMPVPFLTALGSVSEVI